MVQSRPAIRYSFECIPIRFLDGAARVELARRYSTSAVLRRQFLWAWPWPRRPTEGRAALRTAHRVRLASRPGTSFDKVKDAVANVVGAVFSSWVAPQDAVARAATEELGRVVSHSLETIAPSRNATTQWLKAREGMQQELYGLITHDKVRVDGHRRFIEGPERLRDPVRASRMAAALEACRASAKRGEPLTFDALRAWQTLLLGTETVNFRSTNAYAKGGSEVYPFDGQLQARFESVLSEANQSTRGVALRAARAYLDVCFFHPFDDGNGRAARLALDHVLSREGLALHSGEPVFIVGRAAEDAHGAWCLAVAVNHLIGPAPD